MALEQIVDHAERAKARLLQQYKDATAPGVREVLEALAFEVQDVEDALWSITGETSLARAVGLNLERLGAIVGEDRAGSDDESYWVRVAARILVNRSSGSIDDLILLFQVLQPTATVSVREDFPAGLAVRLFGVALSVPDQHAAMLRQARKAGVRSVLEYSTAPTGSGFRFAGGVPGGGKGFPDAALTPGSGGKLAGVKE